MKAFKEKTDHGVDNIFIKGQISGTEVWPFFIFQLPPYS